MPAARGLAGNVLDTLGAHRRADSFLVRGRLVREFVESVAGDEVIMSLAGHVSPAMVSRYSHVRIDAKQRAFTWFIRLKLVFEGSMILAKQKTPAPLTEDRYAGLEISVATARYFSSIRKPLSTWPARI